MRTEGLVKKSLGGLGLALLGLATFAGERDARACGGCFHPPTETETLITDEKMILSVSMSATTLYDQINYSGSPESFAWVLPIKGTVTVGLSADILFQVVNQLTATEVQAPPTNCPPPPSCRATSYPNTAAGAAFAGDAGAEDKSGVTVTAQQQVGPYEAVQLHSNDGSALNAWLTQHGYAIPADTKPIITDYVSQGFDFLALKLIPGKGVQSMQPVRVTSHGAAPTLPLHMVAVGTGASTGITIWVVADGRWAPSNFPTFMIQDSEIAWDWATESSNYESLRLSKEAPFHGRGWQIESSLELNQYSLEQNVLNSVQYTTQGGYTVLPVTPPDGGVLKDAGQGDAAADQTTLASKDLDVLFDGIKGPNARFTRMRSDVAKAALTVDMKLEATSDQTELTNVHTPGQQIGEPQCPIYSADGCQQVGTAPRTVAAAAAASAGQSSPFIPANGGGAGCSTTKETSGSGTTAGLLLAFGAAVALRVGQRRRARRASR